MTIAEKISARFDDDGQTWELPDGTSLDSVCEAQCATREQRGSDTRYEFIDGSAIIASEQAWDLGFDNSEGCFCWAGCAFDYPETNGHNETCEVA